MFFGKFGNGGFFFEFLEQENTILGPSALSRRVGPFASCNFPAQATKFTTFFSHK